jgi:hypothetical protein
VLEGVLVKDGQKRYLGLKAFGQCRLNGHS